MWQHKVQKEDVRHQLENFDGFCNMLMQRIYPRALWVAEAKGTILLFIQLIDRTNKQSIQRQILRYGGVTELKNILGEKRFSKGSEAMETAIDKLANYEIEFEKAKESGRLLREFRKGGLTLKDIKVGFLADYFAKFFAGVGFENEGQRFEYPILNYFFDLHNDCFIALPLIQFGNFDGTVSIIFERQDKEQFDNIFVKKQLIRLISREYEGSLLDWDLVGGNIQRKSSLPSRLEYLISEEYEKSSQTNGIFRELKYRQYYLAARAHFLRKIKHSDAVPDYIKNEHRKRAIISILIDSYAHNISAHSLTVLKWWFQQRASSAGIILKDKITALNAEMPEEHWYSILDFLTQKYPKTYSKEEFSQGLLYNFARWLSISEKGINKGDNFKAVRDQWFSLEEQLTPLFKFLLEKGAFWSGVTRNQQFGGEIQNLYKILWDDFINNPLYLGTIAYSEGITRLNIHIRVYSEENITEDKETIRRFYKIKRSDSGHLLNGILASVDVGGVPAKSLKHEFVQKGELHKELKEALESFEVFLPGGVVGKHAFFTILENEIRNVKHYSEDDLVDMRRDGLNLVIAIRPGSLSSQLDYHVNSLFKIGIWLGHKTRFYGQKGQLAMYRFENLLEDIITPDTNEARLGGIYQDKICAAMLFNNTFLSVQRKYGSRRDEIYYPWVRTAFSKGLRDKKGRISEDGAFEVDFEINNRNVEEVVKVLDRDNRKLPGMGYFKKYVYLWRGDFIFHATKERSFELENKNRFKIVNLPNPSEELRKKLLKEGVIRILEKEGIDIPRSVAYHKWLVQWTKEKDFSIKILQGKTEVGYIFFDRKGAEYYSQKEFEALPEEQKNDYGEFDPEQLVFAHHKMMQNTNSSNYLSIRSNGVLKEKYFHDVQSVENFEDGKIDCLQLLELIEVLKTNVCIFDKRIIDRVSEYKRQLLREQLNCNIFGEILEDWEKLKKNDGIKKYHFVVMHLSFIEGMKDKKGERFGEVGIVRFIEEQLADYLSPNCILVITTGRGRTEWWRKIEDSEYASNVTFRPVESLIEAVEKAILKNDDIELKHNLVKVLFGS